MLRQDDYQKAKLVEAGWLYGHKYGGHLASVMIMSCLANRQRLGWGSWLEILNSIPKYSATIEQPTGTPVIWEPAFIRLLHEVEAVADGSKDFSNGAVYWFDSAEPVTNPWFKEKILDEHRSRVSDMNSLMFFK